MPRLGFVLNAAFLFLTLGVPAPLVLVKPQLTGGLGVSPEKYAARAAMLHFN